MAVSTVSLTTEVANEYAIWTYAAITTNDNHAAIKISRKPMEIIVQAVETAAGSVTLTAEGSLDGTNWFALNDLNNSAFSISVTASATFGKSVQSGPLYFRLVSASVSSASVNATVLIRYI